jgi:hypothetical protein
VVQIDPLVLSYDEERGQSYESFMVVGGDTEAVVAALKRAARRFMQVDEQGIEHDASDVPMGDWLPAPSYCSDPALVDDGVEVYLDCQGSIEPEPEETLRRVLREELEAAGLDGVEVRAVPFLDE